MLLFRKDGIIRLETVLVEKSLVPEERPSACAPVLTQIDRPASLAIGTDPWPWMSRSGFSKQSSS